MSIRLGPLFALLFCACYLLTSREQPWADAHVTYDTTRQLVEEGQLDVRLEGGSPWFYAQRNGKKYGVFPLGNVVAMIPSHLFYRAFKVLPKHDDQIVYAFTSHLAPTAWMVTAGLLFFTLARRRMHSERGALALLLVTMFCTLVLIYARATYSEALQTLLLLWLVERTFAAGEAPTVTTVGWLGLCAGIFVNAKLVNVLFLPSVALYLVYRRSRAVGEDRLAHGGAALLLLRSLLGLLGFAVFVAVALAHNYLKTGSPWDSGYQIKEGIFSGDLWAGLYGLLLSSGKSVFLYSPPLVLAILGARRAFSRRPAETIFLLSLIVVSLLYNAKFRHWHADYCWGPRHLVSLTPLAMLLAAPLFDEPSPRERALIAITAAAGVFVQLLGATIYWDHYIRILIAIKDQTGASGWFQENLSHGHYIPGFSPLQGHWWILKSWITRDPMPLRSAPWQHVVPQGFRLEETFHRARLDWWFLDWVRDWNWMMIYGVVLMALLLGGFGLALGAVRRDRSRST